MRKLLLRFILPLLILVGAGVLTAAAVKRLKKTAARSKPAELVALVEVQTVKAEETPVTVTASGTVTPALEVTVSPQVGGRVVKRSPSLAAGGRFKKGDLIVQIDPSDYHLSMDEARAGVSRAELDLNVESGRQEIAAREWELIKGEANDTHKALALREPHLVAAERGVKAAKSGLSRAQLNLSRTAIHAPFNATVVEENVEVGQIVSPGAPIARLVGTDEFWVRASVPMDALAELSIPGVKGATEGSSARVLQELGPGRVIEREGEVVRLEAQLDPQTRLARVLVRVLNPLDSDHALPLLPGAFVTVAITGRSLGEVFAVPRAALEEAKRVWRVTAEEKLERHDVTVRFSNATTAFVTGLENGDRVVVTPMSMPLEGMRVRIEATAATPAVAPSASGAALLP